MRNPALKPVIYAVFFICTIWLHIALRPAQAYPTQPVIIVVPFSPGGTSDIPARLIAKKLADAWQHPVIVENRPGATGTIGENHVAKAAPDGHTLLMATTSSHTMAPQLLKSPPFNPLQDLRAVSLFGWVQHLLVVRPSLPVSTVAELIELAKNQPDELNYSSSGNGSSIHLATEIFSKMTRTRMNQIPYRGVHPAAMAVASGEVDLMFAPGAVALQHVLEGSMKALSALTPTRFRELPEVPTIAEAGLPEYETSTWIGLLAPAGTPDAIVKKLHASVTRIVNMEDVREALNAVSIDVAALSSEESDRKIKAEIEAYGALIRELDLMH